MSNKKIIRIPDWLRASIREDTREEETYSDYLTRICPEPTEETVLSLPESEMKRITVNDEAHELVHALAGENISAAQVVAYYYERHTSATVDVTLSLTEETDGTDLSVEPVTDGYRAAYTDYTRGRRVEADGETPAEAVAHLGTVVDYHVGKGDL